MARRKKYLENEKGQRLVALAGRLYRDALKIFQTSLGGRFKFEILPLTVDLLDRKYSDLPEFIVSFMIWNSWKM